MKFVRRFAPVAVLLLLAGMAVWAEKPDQLPKPTSYVSDFAGVFDAASKQSMEDLARQLHQKTQTTIEVVTVKSLEGESIEDFCTQLQDRWKVGAKGTDKGLILLFAMAEHKRRIEVGYGLEGILPDAKVGDIGRSMVPLLQQGQYGQAALQGEQQIANVIAADTGATLDAPVQHTYHREPVRQRHGTSWIGILLVLFFFFLLFRRRGGRGGGPGAGSWLPWFLLGNLMGSGRGRYYDRDGGSFGGGGFDGGGGSDSGGNDDFGSGFGGGSGGGGASGDW